jgi:hypothetical protein
MLSPKSNNIMSFNRFSSKLEDVSNRKTPSTEEKMKACLSLGITANSRFQVKVLINTQKEGSHF